MPVRIELISSLENSEKETDASDCIFYHFNVIEAASAMLLHRWHEMSYAIKCSSLPAKTTGASTSS